ncbi:potassium channel family protein [Methanoculleus chikugoensis]|uniref:potassium channel family protein n=1 Tax=Methanoculleus chikugoensis TaxID=118126 RepID=UPI001FB22AF6|nr:potassium channel family protein [Methanoculleus chikugoensis]
MSASRGCSGHNGSPPTPSTARSPSTSSWASPGRRPTISSRASTGSFSAESGGGGTLAFPAFIYFSFVTLATLGYGDITPITDQARSLALLETVSGTLYIAVLIARLVAAAGWRNSAGGE